jgi:hypothetical protein
LRIFFFFIVFVIFTFMLYMRTSDSHFLDEATSHFFNLTDSVIFSDMPLHFSDFTEFLKSEDQDIGVEEINDVSDTTHQFISLKGPVSKPEFKVSESDKVWNDGQALLHRAQTALDWISSTPPNKKTYIRWDQISNSEVHILHKLTRVLKAKLSDSGSSAETKAQFAKLVHDGYQCSPLQASQQELISKFISMDICSQGEWYKTLQLAWPEARRFVDVGANKGYISALLLTLWGGHAFGSAPVEVLAAATRVNAWKDAKMHAGFCGDGFSYGIPLHCPDPTRHRCPTTGKCNVAHQDVHVISLEGSSYLTGALKAIVQHELAPNAYNAAVLNGSLWEFANLAVSDSEGSARFTKQTQQRNAGYEGGFIKRAIPTAAAATAAAPVTVTTIAAAAAVTRSLRQGAVAAAGEEQEQEQEGVTAVATRRSSDPSSTSTSRRKLSTTAEAAAAVAETEEVPMTTVDSFLRHRNAGAGTGAGAGEAAAPVSHVDVLKIDTEENDNRVLAGATETLRDHTGVFVFEGGRGVTFSKYMVEQYDAMGYSCYSPSRAGLFKWNAGCTKDKYMGNYMAKDKGNIFCVSRVRAPMASLAFDLLSFPMLIDDFLSGSSADLLTNPTLRDALQDETKLSTLDWRNLLPLYINVKPFCSPFPACAKV